MFKEHMEPCVFKMKKKRIILFLFLLSVSLLLIVGVSSIFQPKEDNSLSDEQKEKVMNIGIAYVEKNYGTDYIINGDVDLGSYTESRPEGDTVYTYPVASFRVPADYQQSGQLVNVMVDPETGEIAEVYTHPSKSMLPTSPP
jgi:hypothetical protein